MFPCKWKYFSWSLSYKGISNTSANNSGKSRGLFVLEYILCLAVIIEVSEVHFHQLALYSLILIDELFDVNVHICFVQYDFMIKFQTSLYYKH